MNGRATMDISPTGYTSARVPAPNERADPCTLIIFGATGDLTRRKLAPALYHLARADLLPTPFAVIGFARRPLTDEEFRTFLSDAIAEFVGPDAVNSPAWQRRLEGMHYVQSELTDPTGYLQLERGLTGSSNRFDLPRNRLLYLATPPEYFDDIVEQIGNAGLSREDEDHRGWARIILEKPLGYDLASARALNRTLTRVFRERQIYRIDHYLGKESVQNILAFRFGNTIFEPVWNCQYIDHVQITVAESIGVEGRGNYYERAGALRDMVQSHLLGLLSMVGMEPPITLDADRLRDERVRVLRSLRPFTADQVDRFVIRGQYGEGWLGGTRIPGYRQEDGVSPESATDTFVALKAHIDNWRWYGVPFYLRTGKRLPHRVTEIAVQFKPVPYALFGRGTREPDLLVIRIQPDEGILLRFAAKMPGLRPVIRPVNMEFFYNTSFRGNTPEAYETLLHDATVGDSSLFMRWDTVEAAWDYVDPILQIWADGEPPQFSNYTAGTWGPPAADMLLAADAKVWREP